MSLHWTSAVGMKAIKRKKLWYEACLTFTPLHHSAQVNTNKNSIITKYIPPLSKKAEILKKENKESEKIQNKRSRFYM